MKRRLERNIVKEFLLEYNLRKNSLFRITRGGVPPEPDILCTDRATGATLGIEVSIAYYDEVHAKSVWDEFRGKEVQPYLLGPDTIENLRVLQRVEEILLQKSQKNYSYPRSIVLLIVTQSFRLRLTEVGDEIEHIRVPARHPFSEIFVMTNIEGEVYELHPMRRWIFPSTGTYGS